MDRVSKWLLIEKFLEQEERGRERQWHTQLIDHHHYPPPAVTERQQQSQPWWSCLAATDDEKRLIIHFKQYSISEQNLLMPSRSRLHRNDWWRGRLVHSILREAVRCKEILSPISQYRQSESSFLFIFQFILLGAFVYCWMEVLLQTNKFNELI